MSRHRNIRNRNFDDEYAGYDDVYGHSVEDDYCVSPSTADEFLFQRSHHEQYLSSFMKEEQIEEEEEEDSDGETPLGDSRDFQRPKLNPVDEAKMQSCLEEIRNIVGETVPEHILIDTILQYNFNFERALDAILNQAESPRVPPQNTSRSTRKKEEPTFHSSTHSTNTQTFSHSGTIPPGFKTGTSTSTCLVGAVGGSDPLPPPGLSSVFAPSQYENIPRSRLQSFNLQTPPNTPTNKICLPIPGSEGISLQNLSDRLVGISDLQQNVQDTQQDNLDCQQIVSGLLKDLPGFQETFAGPYPEQDSRSTEKSTPVQKDNERTSNTVLTGTRSNITGLDSLMGTSGSLGMISHSSRMGTGSSLEMTGLANLTETSSSPGVTSLSSLALADLAENHLGKDTLGNLMQQDKNSESKSKTETGLSGLGNFSLFDLAQQSVGELSTGEPSASVNIKMDTSSSVLPLPGMSLANLAVSHDKEQKTNVVELSDLSTGLDMLTLNKGPNQPSSGPPGLKAGSTYLPKSSVLNVSQEKGPSLETLSLSSLANQHLAKGESTQTGQDTSNNKQKGPEPVIGLGQGVSLSSLLGTSSSSSNTVVGLSETTSLSSLLCDKTPPPLKNIEKRLLKTETDNDQVRLNEGDDSGKMPKKRAPRRRGKGHKIKDLSKSVDEKENQSNNEVYISQELGDVMKDSGRSVLDSPLHNKPSLFAKVLCCHMQSKGLPETLKVISKISSTSQPVGNLHTHQRRTPYHRQFSYETQTAVSKKDSHKAQVIPFDFSTPSPDDIVKEKQKGAFTRLGDRASLKNGSSAMKLEPSGTQTTAEEDTTQGVARLSFPPRKEVEAERGKGEKKTSREDTDKNGMQVSLGAVGDSNLGAAAAVVESDAVVAAAAAAAPATPSTSSATSTPSMPRVASKARLPTIDVMSEYEKRKVSGKDLVNLVVIGHVDAGKSTLMGHLLYLLGNVNKRTMHKYEQESKKAGKASFAYAWVLDETGEERERGITMDVGLTNFETSQKIVTLLDAPGHKDFIPNMITGAAQADVAVLVVDASRGEFEAGFESGGQTREHALLVRSLGVTQLAVAVNKLDNVDWSQDRYNEIVAKLGHFLKQAGFKDSEVAYIPCSGLTGENLTQSPKEDKLKTWYTGLTLVQHIDKFKPLKRPVEKPFRLCVSDVFKGMGAGFSVAGKIVSGNVQSADKILVMPAGEQGFIKTVLIHEEDTKWAVAGDQATLVVTGIDQMKVNVGSVLCSPSEPIKATTRIQARVIIFNIEVPVTKGYPVVFHYQTMSEPATIKKLISLLHKSTGEVIKKKPRHVPKQSNAVIELETARPVCVELYKDYKDLGRFMLRSGGSTIAAGVITSIL
ncbi:uncharacterized protein LOC144445493 [Glandiceps talaboti]